MVLKCWHYNYGKDGQPCNGTFEMCAKEKECEKGDQQKALCFAFSKLDSTLASKNITQPISSAGCFIENIESSVQICGTDKCEGKQKVNNLYCCCTSDGCNEKLIPSPSALVTKPLESNQTNQSIHVRQDSERGEHVITTSILFLLALIVAISAFLIRRSRSNRKVRTHRNNLLALANRATINDASANHENGISILTPFQESFNDTSSHVQNHTRHDRRLDKFEQIPRFDLKDIELLDLVGSGRFGTAHRANLTQQSGNREIAVKIIKNNEYQSLQNELKIYSSTRHPNILSFLGLCESPETESNMLLVEYAPNGSLHQYLKEHVVTWDELLSISSGIARGLSHLHDSDIAHRDFKSKNVLLKQDLSPCITDFGVATILDMTGGSHSQQRKNYLQVGTPRYMAPEVLECSVSFTKISFTKIDVYALSLVLWELISRCNTNKTQAPVPPYRLPFEEFVGSNPDINQMRQVVVCDKLRPPISDEWRRHPMSRISQAIIDGWEYDHDARISASCFVERIESLSTDRYQEPQ